MLFFCISSQLFCKRLSWCNIRRRVLFQLFRVIL